MLRNRFANRKISFSVGILTHDCLSTRCEIHKYHQVSTDSSCQQKPPPGHRTLGDSTLFSTPKSIDATFPGRCTDGWSGSRCNLQPSLLMDDLMRSWGIHPLTAYVCLSGSGCNTTNIDSKKWSAGYFGKTGAKRQESTCLKTLSLLASKHSQRFPLYSIYTKSNPDWNKEKGTWSNVTKQLSVFPHFQVIHSKELGT